MSETPVDDALEQELDAAPSPRDTRPDAAAAAPVEADEADAAEQASDVPIDEDEYR